MAGRRPELQGLAHAGILVAAGAVFDAGVGEAFAVVLEIVARVHPQREPANAGATRGQYQVAPVVDARGEADGTVGPAEFLHAEHVDVKADSCFEVAYGEFGVGHL